MYRRYNPEREEQRTSEPPRHYTRRDGHNHNAQHHGHHNDARNNAARQPNREHALRHDNQRHDGNRHEHDNHNNRRQHDRRRSNEHNHNPQRREHIHIPPPKSDKNPILSLIPSSVYNPDNGKILGFLSAEDLLLIAMILLFLDSEEEGDNFMVYALLYVLASEWFDVEKFLKGFIAPN